MAITHLNFNDQIQHGRIARRWLNNLEEFLDGGGDLLATIPTMIDGDGSAEGHFSEVTTRFGFTNNATAKAFWEEFQSAMSKVTGDGSVTFVNAALKQILAKCR